MKYIHFGWGGGLYVYYVGIAQAIYDTIDHDELRRCKIGGTSAGMCGALALFFSLHIDDLTPTIFFEKFVKGELIRRGKNSPTGLYLQGCEIAREACAILYHRYYKTLPPTARARLYCIVGNLPFLNPSREEDFQNEREFTTYIPSSLAVPLVFNWKGWNTIGGRRIIDGALTTNRHYVSDDAADEIVFFNIETTKVADPRYKCVDIFAWIDNRVGYILCRTEVNHASLFEKGRKGALAHQSEWKNL